MSLPILEHASAVIAPLDSRLVGGRSFAFDAKFADGQNRIAHGCSSFVSSDLQGRFWDGREASSLIKKSKFEVVLMFVSLTQFKL